MINIKVGGVGGYLNVNVELDSVNVDLGLHDEAECKKLALSMLNAVYDISPNGWNGGGVWICELLEESCLLDLVKEGIEEKEELDNEE